MKLSKILFTFITLIVGFSPAISYAAGCCCLNAMQNQAVIAQNASADQLPCHQDTNSIQQKSEIFNICLCDTATTKVSTFEKAGIAVATTVFKTAYDIESASTYVSVLPQRLFRPPINLS